MTLAKGSIVIERYVYATPKQTTGTQWLVQIVDDGGDLRMVEAFKTRKAAIASLSPEGEA